MAGRVRLKVIRLEKNGGQGNANRIALDNTSYSLVAKMDADDISAARRFEYQVRAFSNHPGMDVIGGQISEFVGEPGNITGIRTVELDDESIKNDMKKRCAMNHVTVMFRKESVLDAGGYIDWFSNEDYYLWVRMVEKGCRFMNLPQILVNVRTGSDMSARRGGWKYFRSEQLIQKLMFDKGMISRSRYLYNVLVRFGGEVLAPNWVRKILFRILRDRPEIRGEDHDEVTTATETDHEPFSVIISVYEKDSEEWFDTAMRSILTQTVVPDEIVLVVDGPVPDSINEVIRKYSELCTGAM